MFIFGLHTLNVHFNNKYAQKVTFFKVKYYKKIQSLVVILELIVHFLQPGWL